MTTDPIAAARALLDARPAQILNYERDLMDMVAALADALEDSRMTEAALRDQLRDAEDRSYGFAKKEMRTERRATKAEAENQRLREALQDFMGDTPPVKGGICHHCGRDYIGDLTVPIEGDCPSDDCPHTTARAALRSTRGGG